MGYLTCDNIVDRQNDMFFERHLPWPVFRSVFRVSSFGLSLLGVLQAERIKKPRSTTFRHSTRLGQPQICSFISLTISRMLFPSVPIGFIHYTADGRRIQGKARQWQEKTGNPGMGDLVKTVNLLPKPLDIPR